MPGGINIYIFFRAAEMRGHVESVIHRFQAMGQEAPPRAEDPELQVMKLGGR